MEVIEYKKLHEREKFFWWNVGRRRILRETLRRFVPHTRQKILDVGCGPGGNMLFLGDFGKVTGLDSSDEALSFAKTNGYDSLVKGDTEKLPFPDDSFDIVALLDVLEHIDDDLHALEEIFRVLRSGGILLLTVPAYRWMWSKHDEALHHKRRYAKENLHAKIKSASFNIQYASYFVIPSIPFRALKIAFTAIKSTLRIKADTTLRTDDVLLPVWLNTLFIWWLAAEKFWMRFFSLPCGSSLLAVAKKPL